MQTTSKETTTHSGFARFMAACHHQQPDATPVWFMRQAGRSLREFREIRKQYDLLSITKIPELCAEVTMMPVKRLGVDGAVLVSDIVVPLQDMGISLELVPDIGPIIHNPVRTLKDVEALRIIDPQESMGYILETLRILDRELEDKQAVIGFSGSPFTLACYMIEGRPSRDYALAKSLMYGQPQTWHALMEKLTEVVSRFLVAQIHAGADVVQLFDSWIGALSPASYTQYVQPYVRRIFDAVKQTGTPSIHFGTGNASLLELMAAAGGDIIGLDWRVNLDEAWQHVGYEHGVQGNLDPTLMLTDWPTIERGMQDVLQRAANRPGHIFNLGHGVLPASNPDLLKQLVDAVHETSTRSS